MESSADKRFRNLRQRRSSLPKGSISDLVKTQYGFHIIQVIIDRQLARTQTFDEIKAAIHDQLAAEKAEQQAETVSAQIAEDIRRSGHMPLDELAKKYNMTTGEAKLVEANQPLPELGNSPGILDNIFHLRPGDLSAPIHTDKGYVVLTVKDIQTAHPGTLAEVHDQVVNDYRREKSLRTCKNSRGRTRQTRQVRRELCRSGQSPRV